MLSKLYKSKVDQILEKILSDQNLEIDDKYLENIFDIMMTDHDTRFAYISYLLSYYGVGEISGYSILELFWNQYKKYPETFIEVINSLFFFNNDIQMFIKKPDVKLSLLPVSKFGQSIILKLFDSIHSKEGNYKIFFCLKSIAASFPFLFNDLSDQVFKIVLPELDNFEFLFRNDGKNLQLFVTAYSASTFVISLCCSSYFFDQFIKYFFNNLDSFNEFQLYGLINILYIIIENKNISAYFQIFILKYNLIEKFIKILEKNYEYTGITTKRLTYTILACIYDSLTNNNRYTIIQYEELSKNVENPLNYLSESNLSSLIYIEKVTFERYPNLPEEIKKYIDDIDRSREFWIGYLLNNTLKKREISSEEFNDFIKNVKPYEMASNIDNIPKLPNKLTTKMVRYLVMQNSLFYCWILYNDRYAIVQKQKEMLIEIINEMNRIDQIEKENKNSKDNIDIELFNEKDYLLPLYCQPILFKNIIKDFTSEKISDLFKNVLVYIILSISKNIIAAMSFFELISQNFTDCYKKLIDSSFSSSKSMMLNSMITLIETLKKLTEFSTLEEAFLNHFIDMCGNNIINIVLTPEMMKYPNVIAEVIELLASLKIKYPKKIMELFSIYFNSDIKINSEIFSILNQFNQEELDIFKTIIFDAIENRKNKMDIIYPFVCGFVNFDNYHDLLLGNMIQILKEKNSHDDYINNIANIFKVLEPEQYKPTDSDVENDSDELLKEAIKILDLIKKKDIFKLVIEKNKKYIIDILKEDEKYLDKFEFIFDMPEIIDFRIRSAYFKTKMKEKISNYSRIDLNINRKNIIQSSFNSFSNKRNSEFYNKFNINFADENSVDEGGPTREWFTLLCKEMFNQNSGLFKYIQNDGYQPLKDQSNSKMHLDYLKFSGKFIACALIHGQNIDAHFTKSFAMHILKKEFDIEDIKTIDQELYNSLNYILKNDVSQMDLHFVVEKQESGIIKEIPLMKNGENTKVTEDNKEKYVKLLINHKFDDQNNDEVKSFCDGFYSIIDSKYMKLFTADELDLLICGIPLIDLNDFIQNIEIEYPLTSNSPIVKYFFSAISKWNNDNLIKLFHFITGTSRVPINGFKEFAETTGYPLHVNSTLGKTMLPVAHTCFNSINLPNCDSEKELNEKLLLAINECDTMQLT